MPDIEIIDQWRVATSAKADFDYWAKQSRWTLEEAAALFIGVDPRCSSNIRKMMMERPFDDPMGKHYFNILDTLERDADHYLTTDIYYKNSPLVYMQWAVNKEFKMHKDLIAAVMKYKHLHQKEKSKKPTDDLAMGSSNAEAQGKAVAHSSIKDNQYNEKVAVSTSDELLNIADRLMEIAAVTDASIKEPVAAIENAAKKIEEAWSRSWLGYQSSVYYDGFERPPAGAHFSKEWGIRYTHVRSSTTGLWREFDPQHVENFIYKLAGNPDLQHAQEASNKAAKSFDELHFEILSIFNTGISTPLDPLLKSLKSDIEQLKLYSEDDYLFTLSPKGQVMSRDSLAFTQGYRVPPHIKILGEMYILQQPKIQCKALSEIVKKAGSYLARKQNTHTPVRSDMERSIAELTAENTNLKAELAKQADTPSHSDIMQPQLVERETLLWIVGVCLHKFRPSGFQADDKGNPLAQHLIDYANKKGIKPKVKNTLSKAIQETRAAVEVLPHVEEIVDEAEMVIAKLSSPSPASV